MADLFEYNHGNTPIDEAETLDLIPSLSTRDELNSFEFENIMDARRWALGRRSLNAARPIDEIYLRDLHRRMFNKVWRWAGVYRKTEKTIGVPPAHIQSDLGALLGDANYWVDHNTFVPLELVARFHHRLVSIHPFSNGNGRHSRLISDVIAAKYWSMSLNWGAGTGSHAEIRARYIEALRLADVGNLNPLISFVGSGKL